MLGLGQEIAKMSLDHLVRPGSKEVLKSQTNQKSTMKGVCQRETGANSKDSQQPKMEQFEKLNK